MHTRIFQWTVVTTFSALTAGTLASFTLTTPAIATPPPGGPNCPNEEEFDATEPIEPEACPEEEPACDAEASELECMEPQDEAVLAEEQFSLPFMRPDGGMTNAIVSGRVTEYINPAGGGFPEVRRYVYTVTTASIYSAEWQRQVVASIRAADGLRRGRDAERWSIERVTPDNAEVHRYVVVMKHIIQ